MNTVSIVVLLSARVAVACIMLVVNLIFMVNASNFHFIRTLAFAAVHAVVLITVFQDIVEAAGDSLHAHVRRMFGERCVGVVVVHLMHFDRRLDDVRATRHDGLELRRPHARLGPGRAARRDAVARILALLVPRTRLLRQRLVVYGENSGIILPAFPLDKGRAEHSSSLQWLGVTFEVLPKLHWRNPVEGLGVGTGMGGRV